MQYIIKAYDGEEMLDKRMEIRPRHLEGIERIKEHVICAGGLLDDEGKMKGSVLIMDMRAVNSLTNILLTSLTYKKMYGRRLRLNE